MQNRHFQTCFRRLVRPTSETKRNHLQNIKLRNQLTCCCSEEVEKRIFVFKISVFRRWDFGQILSRFPFNNTPKINVTNLQYYF